MTDHHPPDPGPERPRSEPEIIPPGAPGFDPRDRAWMRGQDEYRIHRVFIARPGLPSILIALVILGVVVTLGAIVIAGALLLALPIAVVGVLLALFYGPVRYRWHRLVGRLTGRR